MPIPISADPLSAATNLGNNVHGTIDAQTVYYFAIGFAIILVFFFLSLYKMHKDYDLIKEKMELDKTKESSPNSGDNILDKTLKLLEQTEQINIFLGSYVKKEELRNVESDLINQIKKTKSELEEKIKKVNK